MILATYFNHGNHSKSMQDALVLECAQKGKKEIILGIICDGIGGLSQGEFASTYASGQMRKWFWDTYLIRTIYRSNTWLRRSCVRKLHRITRELQQYGRNEHIQLGTTLTMVIMRGRRYELYHVGDSQAFIFPTKGRKPKQLTKDDCLEKGVLCKCIGSFGWRGVQYCKGKVKKGELLFLCSDGMTKRVPMEKWAESLDTTNMISKRQLENRMRTLALWARKEGETDDQAAIAIGNLTHAITGGIDGKI